MTAKRTILMQSTSANLRKLRPRNGRISRHAAAMVLLLTLGVMTAQTNSAGSSKDSVYAELAKAPSCSS